MIDLVLVSTNKIVLFPNTIIILSNTLILSILIGTGMILMLFNPTSDILYILIVLLDNPTYS